MKKGEYEIAYNYYLDAKNIRQKLLGKEDQLTASSLIDIGDSYLNNGQFLSALTYF